MNDERAGHEIESVLREKRIFPPDAAFSEKAHIGKLSEYERLYARSMEEPEAFWGEMAREIHWSTPFTRVLDWKPPFARWFEGGRTNVSYNCLDRHLTTWRRNKVALLWEGEPGETRALTYHELH